MLKLRLIINLRHTYTNANSKHKSLINISLITINYFEVNFSVPVKEPHKHKYDVLSLIPVFFIFTNLRNKIAKHVVNSVHSNIFKCFKFAFSFHLLSHGYTYKRYWSLHTDILSPNYSNLTGSARKIKDRKTMMVNAIEKWKGCQVKGMEFIQKIADNLPK